MQVPELAISALSDSERALLDAAIEKARKNPAAGRAHEVVREEMLQKIAELDARIATIPLK